MNSHISLNGKVLWVIFTSLISISKPALSAETLSTITNTEYSLTLAVPKEETLTLDLYSGAVSQAFTQEGIGLTIVKIPGNRASSYAKAGKIGGMLARTEFLSQQQKELIPIKVNLMTINYWVYIHASNSCPNTISDLDQLTTISLLGTAIYKEISKRVPGTMHTVSSPTRALQVLQAKRTDYIVAPDIAMNIYTHELGFNFKRCFQKPFISTEIYTFLNKRHAHLIPSLERTYKKVISQMN